MLGKKMVSLRKLAKRVKKATKGMCTDARSPPSDHHQPYDDRCVHESLLSEARHHDDDDDGDDDQRQEGRGAHGRTTPKGYLAVYVGEERRRFVVPTGYLSHPLFRMLLEKAGDEFGFDHRAGLAVPCTVAAFREVVAAVESSNGAFDFRAIVDQFL